jgi:hypothetical protein
VVVLLHAAEHLLKALAKTEGRETKERKDNKRLKQKQKTFLVCKPRQAMVLGQTQHALEDRGV